MHDLEQRLLNGGVCIGLITKIPLKALGGLEHKLETPALKI